MNPFWSRQLVLRSPHGPDRCRELLKQLNGGLGPARVLMNRKGVVDLQRTGGGNFGWRPRAILIIDGVTGGGSELRLRLDRSPGVRAFWVLWPLGCITFALTGIGHAPADPLSFLVGLVVAVIFGEFPALLTALVWNREPEKLVDLIVRQLHAGS